MTGRGPGLAGPVIELGSMALTFGRVNRITYHQDGVTPESDTDHTVMLGLVAAAFAATHLPKLDVGLVAQYALIHDLAEVYAGDTPTLRISEKQLREKETREAEAYLRIADMFAFTLPWICTTIADYELLATPEARYVRAMDKLLPKVTHILNGGRTFTDQVMTCGELETRYEKQFAALQKYASDFPPLFELRSELMALVFRAAAERLPE